MRIFHRSVQTSRVVFMSANRGYKMRRYKLLQLLVALVQFFSLWNIKSRYYMTFGTTWGVLARRAKVFIWRQQLSRLPWYPTFRGVTTVHRVISLPLRQLGDTHINGCFLFFNEIVKRWLAQDNSVMGLWDRISETIEVGAIPRMRIKIYCISITLISALKERSNTSAHLKCFYT